MAAVLMAVAWVSACGTETESATESNRAPPGTLNAEAMAGEARFDPLVAGNNECFMARGYFPKEALRTILPAHLTIPDDVAMEKFYPGTPLAEKDHPFLLSFCHGSEIHDVLTQRPLPEQEELMFVFPVVFAADDGTTHLCSYLPVLYLDSEMGVQGGDVYGLRKEHHPDMTHGTDGAARMWWSIENVVEGSFTRDTDGQLSGLPHFFSRSFANPFVTISYPPASTTVFYEATVYPDVTASATGTFSWRFGAETIEEPDGPPAAHSVYSSYSFTMSFPMDGPEYFDTGKHR